MKKLSIIGLAIILVLALAAPQAMAAAKHRWKFINIIPAGQIYTQYFNQLADNITKATNGDVEVTNYPAGELPYKGTDHLKVLNKGLVEMAEVVAGFVFGEAPLLALPDLPYVALNEKEMKIFRQAVIPYIWEELRNRGIEPITVVSYGPRQIVSRKPIKTLADLKGQKIRTAGSLQDAYIKLWGGVPTFVVWAEVYPAAQRGIVDGIMTATLAIQQVKAYEVCPYFFKIDGPLMHQYIAVNKKSWEALSEKNQKAIRKVAAEWTEFWDRKVMHELDESALKEMLGKGHIKTVAELSLEERIKTRKDLLPELKAYVNKHMQPKGPEAFAKALKALGLE
ncbi:MAG: TRAP transporter substrate-binding protein DctP [Deltaproteobacteria bacterium]|nr:TRAP transporter substrate-binding protein DctP [Deltaproteobacteria bacterium]MBW2306884.1 TRAP transporter substrate-binding protein DctP [Deltaproteobacteria bacterium]